MTFSVETQKTPIRNSCSVQILNELPENLAISVLQSRPSFSVMDMLLELPEVHHRIALQASFPSITGEHHFHISPASILPVEQQETVLSRLFTATKELTSLQSLHVELCWTMSRHLEFRTPQSISSAFKGMLQSLQNLTSLSLGNADTLHWQPADSIQLECCDKSVEHYQLLPSVASVLASCLPTLTSLRYLALEGDCSRPQSCLALLEGLQSLTNLQCLVLRHIEVVFRASEAVDTVHSAPTDCEILESEIEILDPDDDEISEINTTPVSRNGVLCQPHQYANRKLQGSRKHAAAVVAACSGASAFGASLARMTSLQSLTISHALLDQAALQPLHQALTSAQARGGSVLQHLTMLCLRGSRCQGVPPGVDPTTSLNLHHLGSVLTCMPSLKHLDLCRCGLTASRVHLMVPELMGLQQLHYIDVGENELGYSGLACLSAAWNGMKNVQTLKLDRVLWGGPPFNADDDTPSVAALIASIAQFSALQHLSLERLAVAADSNDACAVALVQALEQQSSLHSLSLRCISWRASTLKALSAALSNHTQLCALVLDMYNHQSKNSGSGQLAALCSGLSALTSLTKLVMHSRARGSGLPQLAFLTGLKELELWRLQLQDKSACTAVGASFSDLQRLQKLVIVQPCLSTENATYLAPALGTLTQLTELVLDIESRPGFAGSQDSSADGAMIEPIAAEISRLPLLKVLDLGSAGKNLQHSELYAVSRALSSAGRDLDFFNGKKWTPWCFDEWWDVVYSG